jgi:uncharacterized protein YneF (UPF0154 family)
MSLVLFAVMVAVPSMAFLGGVWFGAWQSRRIFLREFARLRGEG